MIGFYAHHQGSGHITRCRAIATALSGATDTTVLSSHPNADVILPMDAPSPSTLSHDQLTAHGCLHWAPPRHEGLARRMAEVARWVDIHRPVAFHVDVSVEMAVFVRAMGIPVTVQAMPGVRADRPHALGYGLADAVIAAWPDWVPLPVHLNDIAPRVHRVGGISRFADSYYPKETFRRPTETGDAGSVTIMLGAGGTDAPTAYWQGVAECLRAAGHSCELIGQNSWVTDPLRAISTADVVVSAAGQNSVADLAALGKRAVVVPQTRPFEEQQATAQTLAASGLAVVLQPDWHEVNSVERWPALIEHALGTDPGWERWQTAGAASRAAQVLLGVAR